MVEPANSPSNGSAAAAPAADGAAKTAKATAQNPAFRMMGLPRLRLPSRNWTIFWTITGSFAGAVIYDKYQTKRTREKWVNLVSHIADERLDTKTIPRRVTIYLQAPPGDGLRTAREHFHLYVKPVLVAAAMDWDVVEGRKEGDVRHKTAEKIRKQRRRNGEGEPVTDDEDGALMVENLRRQNGDMEYPGVAGDIVIGRHTWKEYIRGLHEGYLGPASLPKEADADSVAGTEPAGHAPASTSANDAIANATSAHGAGGAESSPLTSLDTVVESAETGSATDAESVGDGENEDKKGEESAESKEKDGEQKPKRRFPPSPILPEDYSTAVLSPSTPEILGPSVGVRLPHLLGIKNTPVRIYRFLTRRRLQEDIGRQVAAAVLASYRPYTTVIAQDDGSASDVAKETSEQATVLQHEEKDWYKLVHKPRAEHEESLWIEPITLDERIANRMRAFELTSADEERSRRIAAGKEAASNQES
ncbi:hypothetical protein CKM354_000367300 [Cercospora kikuchii]|uniref:Mitochondrial import inner membrane translocase subunit TIM54 n=1 Tax=Cercospora kikuchii TaxID=84275 RepID=A0A9P3C9Z1_9PEZI|nr:uncharacterized protein CKM354_000367300 [Cercospora kikuchii]GIZ40329.1 hypothetical protein CKM354_000367300 [Cercospora kikuchii]